MIQGLEYAYFDLLDLGMFESFLVHLAFQSTSCLLCQGENPDYGCVMSSSCHLELDSLHHHICCLIVVQSYF